MGQALPSHSLETMLVRGTVQVTDGNQVLFAGSGGLIRAERAASCLLAPRPRDTVLAALLDDGSAWVLAVLGSSAEENAAELRLPRNTEIRAETLAISSGEATLSAQNLSLKGKKIDLEGESVGIASRLLSLGGQICIQGFAVVRTFARSLAERAQRRVSHYGSLSEEVTDLSKRAAGRSQLHVETSLRVRAENADIRASEQVDIDASHIKVG
ncbi:MAG: DUF3540 domain-containing protein [Deltaproteobacteria bacterium]|nr:DUF3540 domain-containing protein [Deltaproteobacteria bacterium]